ncbi:MAG: FAD-dependent monooxygenase [Rickettsiaceae bacterium H1]|nr:FAD-dependent monooxygenase [Rickettsiaceae bacterium H1]
MHYDVIISGAGMAGMTLAVAFKACGFSVTVIEKSPPKFDERTTALNHLTKKFFQKYKIWEFIENHIQPISDIFTVEGKSTSYLHYDHRISGNDPMGYVVKNRAIKKALDSFKVEKLSPLTYEKINNYGNRVELTLSNDKKLSADLFVCAEGKNSHIYELLGIKRIIRKYNQSCVICNVEHIENHQAIAQERFYPTGPFALLPMKGDFFSSLIWTAETEMAENLIKLSKNELIREINKHCNFHITKIISNIQLYPINISLARKYYKNRILLMGDVMQSIHPVAGQGFNLIIRNIENLITQIGKYAITKKALQKFSQDRIIDNLLMAGTTHSLVKLFSNNNKMLKTIRSTGLTILQELPFIKRKLVNYAMGKNYC